MTNETVKLRNSVIVTCTNTACEFANGDIIVMSDDAINCTDTAYEDGVLGYCNSFDYYDARIKEWFGGYDIFNACSGHLYELVWYEIETTEYGTDYVSDFEYAYDKPLATMPLHPTEQQYWHAIYDAIQVMSM